MPLAGYNCTVKVTGSTTAFTGEATTNTSGNIWQITDANKRVWDPSVTPSFFDNGVAIASGDISSIDYLFGKVTFTGVKVGPITVTGSYFPLYSIAEGKEFTGSFSRDILDDTVFGDTFHSKKGGLQDCSGSIGTLDDTSTDMDSGGSTFTAWDLLANSQAKVVEFYPGAGDLYRMWVIFDAEEVKAAVDGLVESTLNFQGCAQIAADGTPVVYARGT